MKKNKKKFRGGSHPEESYDKQLPDDPAYMKPSVYVPDDIKTKINKWAEDMGMKKESKKTSRKKIVLETYSGYAPKKVELTHEFVEKVLGFNRVLLETVNYDYDLQDELLREYFLHESFLDSVENVWKKVKQKTDETAFVIKSIKNVLSTPENIDLVQEQTLSLISRHMNRFLTDQKIDPNIKNILKIIDDKVKKNQGWKSLLLSASFLVVLSLMSTNKEWLESEGAMKKMQKIIEEFNNGLMQNPSVLSNVIGWISALSDIVSNLGNAIGELAKIFKRVNAIKMGIGKIEPATV